MTASGAGRGWSLPQIYARGGLYLRLRVCERYGKWMHEFEALPGGVRTMYLAQERVRIAEEERAGM